MKFKQRWCWQMAYLLLLLMQFEVDISNALVQQQSSDGQHTSTPTPPDNVRGLPVHRAFLRQHQSSKTTSKQKSPYCFAVSSISNLPPSSNFLATQVWPSARVAARAIEEYALLALTTKDTDNFNITNTICELGCGPGLPSLTAAATIDNCHVIVTDIDDLALDLVMAAACEQNLPHKVATRIYDLIHAKWEYDWMDNIDLFVLSDVFESEAIAKGAAKLTTQILAQKNGSKIWVFAQSDRAQREVYLEELKTTLSESPYQDSLHWSPFATHNPDDRLWLCDLDETKVDYG